MGRASSVFQIVLAAEGIHGADPGEGAAAEKLFHDGIDHPVMIGIGVDIGLDHGHIQQMIGILQGDEQGGHHLHKPGDVVPRAVGGVPVEPGGGLVAGVFHVADIDHQVYIKYGSEAAVREAGKMGVEGKES